MSLPPGSVETAALRQEQAPAPVSVRWLRVVQQTHRVLTHDGIPAIELTFWRSRWPGRSPRRRSSCGGRGTTPFDGIRVSRADAAGCSARSKAITPDARAMRAAGLVFLGEGGRSGASPADDSSVGNAAAERRGLAWLDHAYWSSATSSPSVAASAALRLCRRLIRDGRCPGVCLPPSRVAASNGHVGSADSKTRTVRRTMLVLTRESDSLAWSEHHRGAPRNVVAQRHEQRRGHPARGRHFLPRACSRTASRLAIPPPADPASEERCGAKPRNVALVIAGSEAGAKACGIRDLPTQRRLASTPLRLCLDARRPTRATIEMSPTRSRDGEAAGGAKRSSGSRRTDAGRWAIPRFGERRRRPAVRPFLLSARKRELKLERRDVPRWTKARLRQRRLPPPRGDPEASVQRGRAGAELISGVGAVVPPVAYRCLGGRPPALRVPGSCRAGGAAGGR